MLCKDLIQSLWKHQLDFSPQIDKLVQKTFCKNSRMTKIFFVEEQIYMPHECDLKPTNCLQ